MGTLGYYLGRQRGGAAVGPQQDRGMHALFQDDLEELGGSALPPAQKTYLDDVLAVRLALHEVRNIQDNASHFNSNDFDRNGYSPPRQDGSVDDLCVLQGGRGGRRSASYVFLSRDTSPTALAPSCHHCSDTHLPLGNGTRGQGPASAHPQAPPQMISPDGLLPEASLCMQGPSIPLSQSPQSDMSTSSWLVTALWVGHRHPTSLPFHGDAYIHHLFE